MDALSYHFPFDTTHVGINGMVCSRVFFSLSPFQKITG